MFLPKTLTEVSTVEANAGRDYPPHKQQDIRRFLERAWRWAESHKLVEPAPGPNGHNGWKYLTDNGAAAARDESIATLTSETPALADIEKLVPTARLDQTNSSDLRRSAIILTALHVETRAVLRHLSDVREEIERGTVFHVGRFGEWVVAVAECGDGNVHAATIVERGIARYNPDVALFVGVAGGVKDVIIGDALVSSKVYGYERGKDTGEGFKPRPVVQLPAYTLEQRARAIRLRDDWQRRLDTNLPHATPRIHVGAIAAGEKVISSSSGKIAEFLKQNYGDALGVEMEGQGFLAAIHINAPVEGCVVRGISDLLDGKTDADKAGSQGKAADVASAVAYEMLATLRLSTPRRKLTDARQQHPDERERPREVARKNFSPEADMPIRDVFFHINADVLDDKAWEKIGQHLLDALSIGALSAYGREGQFGHQSYRGHPNLTLIDCNYWKTARFTYDFFGANRENEIHVDTAPPGTGLVYRDVRFNRSDIESGWPTSRSKDRIFAMDAIYRILTQSEWAKNLAAQPELMTPAGLYENSKTRKEMIKDRLLHALRRDIHDRLRSAEIEAWGRKHRNHPLAPIKAEEWDNLHITTDDIDFRNLKNGFCTQNFSNQAMRSTCYENVQFVRSKLFSVYPLLREPFEILENGTVL